MLGIAQNLTATWGTNDAPPEWPSHIDFKEPNKNKKGSASGGPPVYGGK